MNWNRLESLFLELLELEPGPREERLAAEPDVEIRDEVRDMLEAHEGDELTIESRLLAPVETPDLVGQRVGNYRLLGLIGHGGMGEVYLARRDDDLYERDVAIKLVQHGPRPSLRERFARERAILARLTHPNVATLYDGGVHEDGRPYLVMEYVEGLPITEYCDANELGIRERIELFIRVCEAVQFAHGALIVHRDLKASNILVGAGGTPKLLDFGIARLLEDEPGETQALDRVLTPEHAAPEQIRGEQATTATDVYGLGVLLCELLAGARPIRFPTRSPVEIDRIAREVEPTLPSRLLDEEGARLRRTSRHRLEGDLDAICAKALRKEPEERYVSTNELIADLRRHLNARPVRAMKGTRAYFARKFLRRHRTSLALSAAAFLFLAAFLATTLLQAAEVRAQRDRAQREAERAEMVLDHMVALFEEAQPRAAGEVDALDVGALLERGEETAAWLEHDPDAQGRMFELLAKIYTNRGRLDRAVELMTRARDQEEDELDRLRLDHEIALLRARHEGFEAGIPLLRESLARHEALLGADHPDVVQARIDLGTAVPDPEEARSLLEPALARLAAAEPARASALNALATREIEVTNFARARDLLEEADAILAVSVPDAAPARMTVLHNLSAVYARLGMWTEAVPIQQRMVDTRLRLYGEDSDLMANSLEALAVTEANLGRHDDAAGHFAQALAIFERTLAPGHWRIANGERNVGQLLSLGGRYEEALPHFDRAIEIAGARSGAHQRAQRALAWIGLGRTAEAVRELESIRATMEAPGSDVAPPYRADVRLWLGLGWLHEVGPDAARPHFEEALALRREGFPATHPKVAEARCAVAAAGGTADPDAAATYRAWGLAHPLFVDLLDR